MDDPNKGLPREKKWFKATFLKLELLGTSEAANPYYRVFYEDHKGKRVWRRIQVNAAANYDARNLKVNETYWYRITKADRISHIRTGDTHPARRGAGAGRAR